MLRNLLVILIASPALAATYTLDQALETAMKKNRDLRSSVLALENTTYGVEAAAAQFALAIRPAGNVSSASDGDAVQFGLTASKASQSGTTLSVTPQVASTSGDNLETTRAGLLRVEIEQPLFRRSGTLVNREGLTQAERAVFSSRRDLELRRNDLVVQVVGAHETLVQLQQREVYESQAFTRLDKIYRLAAARERQGNASRVDTLRAELQLGRAKSSLQTTRQQLESGRRDYSDLLGLDPTTNILAAAGARLEIAPPRAELATAVAFSNRLDYAQVLQDLGDAERGIKIARKNLLPDVSVIARYDWLGEGPGYSDALRLNDDAWFVGLAANNTDLRGTAERAALKSAQSGKLSSDLRVEIVRSAVERQVQNELSAYQRAQEQVAVEERNYKLASEQARLARRLYEMSRADNFTASDAEDQLQLAEASVLSARAEASLAAYRVLRALGTLIEAPADLKPGRLP